MNSGTGGEFAVICGGSGNSISSNYSFVGGGGSNGIGPSAYSVICGGRSNSIQDESAYSTIGGGYENYISANAPTATIGGGAGNLIDADAASGTIGGGEGNAVSATRGWVPGGTRANAHLASGGAHASGSFGAAFGTAQTLDGPVIYGTTESATPGLLTEALVMHPDSCWHFDLMVVGMRTNGAGTAAYRFTGCSRHDGAGTATLLASTKTVVYESDAGYDASIAVLGVGTLQVTVTGQTGHDMRWVCYPRIVEVTAGE